MTSFSRKMQFCLRLTARRAVMSSSQTPFNRAAPSLLPVLTLLAIVIAAVIGGIASSAVAAFALYARLTSIERWVAFAVGAMLAVFLDILPHALSEGVAPAPRWRGAWRRAVSFLSPKNS